MRSTRLIAKSLSILMVLSFLSSCNRFSGSKITDQTSITEGSSANSDLYLNSFAKIRGSYTFGDVESIAKMQSFTDFDRAVLTVSADRAATATLGNWESTSVPYVTVPPDQVKLTFSLQKHDNAPVNDGTNENILDAFSKRTVDSQCSMIIPYHPDTNQKPPLVDRYFQAKNIKNLPFDAFNSMSRSLFIINNNSSSNNLPLLFSIKMGTDTVKSVSNPRQPSKLLGLQEHVKRVNRFGDSTSILQMAREEGIILLQDSVGINFSEKDANDADDNKNNGIIIRTYDPIISDKDRIYMPLEKFLNPASVIESIFKWELHKSNLGTIDLKIEQADLVRMTQNLAKQYGKLMAIYYFNGYTSRDMHGQNVLVGIPLNKDQDPILAVRDLTDHASLPFMVEGYKSGECLTFPNLEWNSFITRSGGMNVHQLWKVTGRTDFVNDGFRLVLNRIRNILDSDRQNKVFQELDFVINPWTGVNSTDEIFGRVFCQKSSPAIKQYVNLVRKLKTETKDYSNLSPKIRFKTAPLRMRVNSCKFNCARLQSMY